MPKPFSFGEIHLDTEMGRSDGPRQADPDSPFHLLILGDFSGRASRGVTETGGRLAARKPIQVDRDNLDEVMRYMDVQLEVPVAGRIRFTELDDFLPDRLWSNLSFFDKLKLAREEARAKPARRAAATPSVPRAAAPPPPMSLGGLLDQAVEETESVAENRPSENRDPFRSWVSGLVEGEEAPADLRSDVDDLIDRAANAQMRSLLHFPSFQALEAAWRGVDFLARRVDTSELLKIFLLDVSKEELAADLEGADDLAATGTAMLLMKYSRQAPWAALVCNYRFGSDAGDVGLLARLGMIASAIEAPLLAEADPSLANASSEPEWMELRRHVAARGVGLALPRFLLRLPYGADTVRCDEIQFEEMPGEPERDRYLWGNPALICALLLAESFGDQGWNFRPGGNLNVSNLPLHLYRKDGEAASQPCAEHLMTVRTAETLLERGLMPLASLKDTDSVRLVRFQSIADPPAALAGRWA